VLTWQPWLWNIHDDMRKWVSTYRDILHIYFSPYYKSLPSREFEKVAPRDTGKRLRLILKTLQRRIFQILKSDLSDQDAQMAANKIWLFATSKNNMDALAFLKGAALSDTIFVLDKHRPEFSRFDFVVPNLRYQAFYSIKFLLLWLQLFLVEGNYASRISNIIFRSLGFYEEWGRLLQKYRPKAIVFSNDHIIESRSLLLAAIRLRVPTIYIQHASVSPSFPPLKFDLNLLEGLDAHEKYRSIGTIRGKVHLVGMPKFDSYLKFRKSVKSIRSIGIPYNLNDDITILELLITALHKAFPDRTITIRKHPKDKSEISLRSRFQFLNESDPYVDSAFDFLVSQDCIIAGNSSIHLESTLLNIPSIYFRMGNDSLVHDYYGYVHNGLVSSASGIEDVITLITKHSEDVIFHRASYYNATVGGPCEGKSQELAARSILRFLQPDDPNNAA
jgi:hypothetical protein